MHKRMIVASSLALFLMLRAGPAFAPFHLLVIEEVFFGTEDCPDAQYVQLRTFEFGQTFVITQRMMTALADGRAAADFGVFTSNPQNPARGVAILMGTQAAQSLFGIRFDAVVAGRLPFPDGRVCFGDFLRRPVDCVAYGIFAGNNLGYGEPAPAPVLGMALRRQSETNNNAVDFVLADPMPENNAGERGAPGQCPQPPVCAGDCDGDAAVTVDEIIRGVNIALGISAVADCPSFDTDASGEVTVDEIVAAVTRALEGCSAGFEMGPVEEAPLDIGWTFDLPFPL